MGRGAGEGGDGGTRGAPLALRPRRAGDRHGGDRRRDAAHGVGAFDHGMEACHGRHPALLRHGLGGGVREISRLLAIPEPEPGHGAGRVQDDLLVGMEPPAARPFPRRLFLPPPHLPLVARTGHEPSGADADRHRRAGRPPGDGRLDHGRVRARTRHDGRRAAQAHAAPRHRERHPRPHRLGRGRAHSGPRARRWSRSSSSRSRSAVSSPARGPAGPTTRGR